MIWSVVCVAILTRGVPSRLVIEQENLADIDSHMIEEKATIVNEFIRENSCKGVKVFQFCFISNNISFLPH